MSLRYGLLNPLILCIVLFLSLENYEIWTQPLEKITLNKSEGNPQSKLEVPSTIEARKDSTSIQSFPAIAEKNIFSPERKEFQLKAVVETNKPIVRPQIVLSGVLIAGDYQVASIVNPGKPLRKGERETLTAKAGDRIGEYKLAKILPDRITLEAQGDSYEVLLYDSKMPKRRTQVKAESKSAAIATTITTTPLPVSPSPAPTTAESPKSAHPQVSGEATKESVPGQLPSPSLRQPTAPPSSPPNMGDRQRMRSIPYSRRTATPQGAKAN